MYCRQSKLQQKEVNNPITFLAEMGNLLVLKLFKKFSFFSAKLLYYSRKKEEFQINIKVANVEAGVEDRLSREAA